MMQLDLREVRRFCDDEYKDYVVYSMFARLEGDGRSRKILEELANTEHLHYQYWKSFLGNYEPKVNGVYLLVLRLAKVIFGLVFILKLLERHEEETVLRYREYSKVVDEKTRSEIERIVSEELEHEKLLLNQLDDRVVRYVGFIALGLADAIIEVSGVHAGFLGVTSSTLIAGVAGLIVGFAASMSMAAAAYLQSKSAGLQHPINAAVVTGTSYIAAVVFMALPYFLTRDMLMAFSTSVAVALLIGAIFTTYSAVVNERPIWKEIVENSALLIGVAAATYFFGEFLGEVFGIQSRLF